MSYSDHNEHEVHDGTSIVDIVMMAGILIVLGALIVTIVAAI